MEPPGPRAEPDCAPPAPPLPGPGGDTQSAIYGYVAGGLGTQCQWTSDPIGSSSGKAGVEVKITGDLYGAGTTDTTDQTDTRGCYLFAGLASATVPVSFTVSLPGAGLTHTCDPDGTADGTTDVTVDIAGADVGPIRFGVSP